MIRFPDQVFIGTIFIRRAFGDSMLGVAFLFDIDLIPISKSVKTSNEDVFKRLFHSILNYWVLHIWVPAFHLICVEEH